MEGSRLLLTVVCALLGGAVGHWLKIPAGPMIGSLLGVAAANLSGLPLDRFPRWTSFAIQVALGATLGLQITRGAIGQLKTAWAPALLVSAITILFGVAVGWMIAKIAGWDPVTSYFSSAPGGMSDILIIADSTGADTSKVMLLHLVRLVTVILTVPLLFKLWFK